jgi:hypothetical protein
LVFRVRECSAKVCALPLQRDPLWLEVAPCSIDLFTMGHAGGIASRRELLGKPHEREAIARVGVAPRVTWLRPADERRGSIGVLLQGALNGAMLIPDHFAIVG